MAFGSIHSTSQWWPSRSWKLQPYMKPWSIGSLACVPPASMARRTISSTSARLPHDSANMPSVTRLVSAGSCFVKVRKNGSVSSMKYASSLMTMHAAFSSVNCLLNVKPRLEKNSIDFVRSRTAMLTNSLRLMITLLLSGPRADAGRACTIRPTAGRRRRRKQDMAEQRIADADVRGHGAAEVAGPEDRAEDARARDEVRAEAGELDDAENGDDAGRIADFLRPFDDGRQLQHLHRSVHRQEQHGDAAEHASGPHLRAGGS